MNTINSESFHKRDYEPAGKEREILRSSDLDKLLAALIISMENFEYLAAATSLPGLKAIYKEYANERAVFSVNLHLRLGQDDQISVNEEGSIIGRPKPVWAGTSFSNTEADSAEILLSRAINNDLFIIKKYDEYLRNNIPVIKDLNLLVSQQDAIKQAVKKL
jgi:hypothetical protein